MLIKILFTVAVVGGIHGILAFLLVVAERFFADYGQCTITLNNEKELYVTGGSTLLSTLNTQKIFLPSACGGRGTCAYCKCKIIDGAGPVLPTETPLLTKEEIEDHVRLACQIKVKQDLRIQIPEALFSIKEFEAEVALIKDLTYDIKLVRLKLIDPDEIVFKPGQYVQLQSRSYDGVKESVSRAYSIASPHFENKAIDLMVRLVPDGICTKWVHEYLNEGDQVKFTGPMGDFCLREGKGEVILVAGGSGMAPMVSMLSDLAETKSRRRVVYFFGVVTQKDLFYLDEMKQFEKTIDHFTFVPVLSQPETEDQWKGKIGLVTVPLEEYIKTELLEETQAYLCGSPGMIRACIDVLKKNGITEDRIFYDPFA